MDDALKIRSVKARLVTRRNNELSNAIKTASVPEDIVEKITLLKKSIDELGLANDDVLSYIDETDLKQYEKESKWYDEYDVKVNLMIKGGRHYIASIGDRPKEIKVPQNAVKLKKLEIPKFDSDPKAFFKWKEHFERFTNHLKNETRYDYSFTSTTGKAHELVSNKNTYVEAMDKLNEKFGNIHLLLDIRIDEIKRIPVIRKGDFIGFEQLSYQVNDFCDRLRLMGLEKEVENSYILKEIENKLSPEDTQKWLESLGKNIDKRKVRDVKEWLENQTNLRRIAFKPQFKEPLMSKEKFRHTNYINNAARPMDCEVCNDGYHEIKKCSKFISLPIYEKWEVAKRLKLCFQCLGRDHHRMDYQGSKCQYCMRPHDSMLHNSFNTFRNPVNHEESTHNSAPGKNVSVSVTIPRCYLPIVKATVVNERIRFKAVKILDSGSELNVISTRLYNKLGLKGSPVTVNIVGITGTVTQKNTPVADVMVEDQLGVQTMLQCIVLDKTCGKALPLDKAVLSLVKEENIFEKQLVSQGGEIELLIGMNTPRLHQQISMHGKKQDLLVIETRFGPSIVGRAPMEYSGNYI